MRVLRGAVLTLGNARGVALWGGGCARLEGLGCGTSVPQTRGAHLLQGRHGSPRAL